MVKLHDSAHFVRLYRCNRMTVMTKLMTGPVRRQECALHPKGFRFWCDQWGKIRRVSVKSNPCKFRQGTIAQSIGRGYWWACSLIEIN